MQCVNRFRPGQIQGYSFLTIGILLWVSCTSTTSPPSTNAVTAAVTISPVHSPVPAMSEESTRPATVTNTVQPTTTLPALTPSPTPSATNTSTPEPTATLTSEQKADAVTKLMMENDGCELPCWWGIVPGGTNIKTIPEQFAPHGLVSLEEGEQLYIVLQHESLVWLERWKELYARSSGPSIITQFAVENDIIQSIRIQGGGAEGGSVHDWKRYSLDQVLTRYGVPSQVLVYYPWQAHPEPAFFHLLLFYEASGIGIEYVGVAKYTTDGKMRACPNLSEITRVNLFLYQPEKIDNVIELVLPPENVDFDPALGFAYDLIKWEQTVGTSLESFYETFKDGDSSNCFDFTIYRYR